MVFIWALRVRRGLVPGVHLIPAEPLILRFRRQPRKFDLRCRAFAAQDIRDLSGGTHMAVNVGLVGVCRDAAGGDDVGGVGSVSEPPV